MQVDIAGERPGAFRLEHAGHDLALAMLYVADVFGGELRHRLGSSVDFFRARLWCPRARIIAAASVPRPPRRGQCENYRGQPTPSLASNRIPGESRDPSLS